MLGLMYTNKKVHLEDYLNLFETMNHKEIYETYIKGKDEKSALEALQIAAVGGFIAAKEVEKYRMRFVFEEPGEYLKTVE